MEDIDLLIYMGKMDREAPLGEIVSFVREEEGQSTIEFLARFNHDFSGKMEDLVDKGLVVRRYTSGANHWLLSPKGKAEVAAVLG